MGFIIQLQRRAIESLRKFNKKPSFAVSPKIGFKLADGRKLYLLGFSEGIGTCSDFHGIDIPVFDFSPPDRYRERYTKELIRRAGGKITCEYGVLLRDATHKECLSANSRTVQLLSVKKKTEKELTFSLTHKKSSYAPM